MLRLTLACGGTDRTLPLALGDVRPQGVELNCLRMQPEEVFWRMTRHAEFDAAEMSLSSQVLRRSRGDDALVAIPVFPSREFRHGCVFVRADAQISEVADLRGRPIGVPEYQMTAAVWIRGFLADDYDLAPTAMRWFTGGLYEPGRVEKLAIDIPGLDLQPIGPSQTLSDMLLQGELDAVIGPRAPRGFPLDRRVRRLFPKYREVEADYFRRTRIFPIMHTVVIRKDVLERDPWVARSLFDAFCEAKARVMALLREPVVLAATLPWLIDEVERTTELMGDDYWPYGVEANRPTLEALLRYSHEQGLAARRMSVEELFAPSTLDSYRV
ncbi:MAG: ABC transporter substrate-binding protein [Chloroflexi bacterium]|nr:ABC transporter substrate-binding protein [Chloroflexota bacterium]